MQAEHLALLPWSAFVSLTSGVCNRATGRWYYVPCSRRWWLNSCFGYLRRLAGQHHQELKALRFVIRLEQSPQRDLLHAHMLVWTGKPWNRGHAFRANSLWREPRNGTRHCTPYDASLAGASYILKGLDMGDSVMAGFAFEAGQFAKVAAGLGCVICDDNTVRAIHARVRRGLCASGRIACSPPSGTSADTLTECVAV
jgi:hypothetical protein